MSGCPKFPNVDNCSLNRGFQRRTIGLKMSFVRRRMARVGGRTSSSFRLMFTSNSRIRTGAMVCTTKTAPQETGVPKRRRCTKGNISCYTVYSKSFCENGSITILNNKSATLSSTICLTSITRGMCIVREEGRFQKTTIAITGLERGRGIVFMLRRRMGRVVKRRGMAKMILRSTTIVSIGNMFITCKTMPRASLLGGFTMLSSSNCIETKRAKRATLRKLCITKSTEAGGLHRIMATISSNTGTTATITRCLG